MSDLYECLIEIFCLEGVTDCIEEKPYKLAKSNAIVSEMKSKDMYTCLVVDMTTYLMVDMKTCLMVDMKTCLMVDINRCEKLDMKRCEKEVIKR